MHDAPGGDPERRRDAGAKTARRGASGDVGHVGTGRDVEQQPCDDEQPEVVNAVHEERRARPRGTLFAHMIEVLGAGIVILERAL